MADTQRSILRFDGSKNIVNMGKRPEHKVRRDITLEAWICAERQTEYDGIVSRVFDTGATESGYCLALDGAGGIYCGIRTTSGPAQSFYYSSGANTLTLNQWHHVAATYDGREVVIYIDGVEKNRTSTTGDIDYVPDHPLAIGAYRDDNEVHAFQGKIAEVRIWSAARTADQIRATMNERLSGDEAGLVGYWPLDEGTGDVATDRSKTVANGKITGATWETETVSFAQPKSPPPPAEWEKACAELDGKIADLAGKLAKCGDCEAKLAEQKGRLDGIDAKLADQVKAVDGVSAKLAGQAKAIDELAARVAGLATKVEAATKPAPEPPTTPHELTIVEWIERLTGIHVGAGRGRGHGRQG